MATNGDARFDVEAQARAVGGVATLAIILLLLAGVYNSFTVIKPGNVGVVFNRWSGSLKAVGQGIAWRIPWITQGLPVIRIKRRNGRPFRTSK